MSSYWSGAWNSLKFSAGNSANAVLSNIAYRYLKGVDGTLIYKNNRAYKYVAVHVAKQMAMQAIESEVNKLFPRYQKYLRDKTLQEFQQQQQQQQQQQYSQLIANGNVATNGYGQLVDDIVALNKYGEKVKEALIIWYEGSDNVTEVTNITNSAIDSSGDYKYNIKSTTFQTKKRFVIDLAPQITVQSSKNVLLTQVQGRDFTRKELISGGDLIFNVSGEFNSNFEGVYPTRDVQKFINIMQYNGIISVNNLIFGQLNVNNIIIQSYQLGNPTCKNAQPYSFTCVAVEPNENVTIKNNTLRDLNYQLSISPVKNWTNIVLNNKLAEFVANGATVATSSFTNAGLDVLISKI